tara:strand:- start:1419 stop:1625 length:207 start_codon:yes stop_codon:yes gene_type:complete
MSKLETAIDVILKDARQGFEKVAAPVAEEPTVAETEAGTLVRKLASDLRETSDEPTYDDIRKFVGGVA